MSKKKTLLNILLPLLLVVLFISIILIIKAPIKQSFEYNMDEGIDLMASLLISKGFSLYKQIWYEHPPLVPVILSYWFKLLGPSVHHGRLLILIFSGIFLWAFYQTIKNLWGHLCAFAAVVFLLLSTLFLHLHISVMLSTPARALAMLSIYYITLYKKSCLKRFLVLSGVFMALSLQVKLTMLFLVPFIALEIVYTKWISSKTQKN
ncbi:MAG: glycosyltransferase family 39 protein [Candidatus Omnitrophica bacterium]|nr:glycosyltransferase family 39 protein [Candidatus Omnitrophota bacterium]